MKVITYDIEIDFTKTITRDGSIFYSIKNFKGIYYSNEFGEVISFKQSNKGKQISGYLDKFTHTDYRKFSLKCENGKSKTITQHRLVLLVNRIPNPEGKQSINHIDNDGLNNSVSNLEWCTNKENSQHAAKQGRLKTNIDNSHKVLTKKWKDERELSIGQTYGTWTVLNTIERTHTRDQSKVECICTRCKAIGIQTIDNVKRYSKRKGCSRCARVIFRRFDNLTGNTICYDIPKEVISIGGIAMSTFMRKYPKIKGTIITIGGVSWERL